MLWGEGGGGNGSSGFNFSICFSKVQKTPWGGWESLTFQIL